MNTPCFGSHGAAFRSDHLLISETRHTPSLRTPAHEHDVALLHFVLSGLYEESTPAGRHRLGPGWILFKPAGEVHWNEFNAGGAVTLRIELDPNAVAPLHRRLPSRMTTFRTPHLQALAGRAHHELSTDDDLSALVAESLALELFAGIARTPAPSGRPGRHMARACAALLDAQFARPVALSHVARELGVDRTALARVFRREYGCSVGDYIRMRRVEYVADALSNGTPRSLSELALEAGFSDQSHLTRTFGKLYGQPPGTWRKCLRGGVRPQVTVRPRAPATLR